MDELNRNSVHACSNNSIVHKKKLKKENKSLMEVLCKKECSSKYRLNINNSNLKTKENSGERPS